MLLQPNHLKSKMLVLTNLFKDVLVLTRNVKVALEVSEGGLRINFKVDDYDVTYYLVVVQDVD